MRDLGRLDQKLSVCASSTPNANTHSFGRRPRAVCSRCTHIAHKLACVRSFAIVACVQRVGVSNYKPNTNFTPNLCATACWKSLDCGAPNTDNVVRLFGWVIMLSCAHTTIEREKFGANQQNIYDVRLARGQHVHPDAYHRRWSAMEVGSLQPYYM